VKDGIARGAVGARHGADGRGRAWRATVLFLRPGDLTAGPGPEGYVRDIIRQGGASFGKPGMPSFGYYLSEADLDALLAYLRTLARGSGGSS
jgi:mono/diheme cytochrome c family protein